MSLRNRRIAAICALAVVVPLSGCGTRMSKDAIERADGSGTYQAPLDAVTTAKQPVPSLNGGLASNAAGATGAVVAGPGVAVPSGSSVSTSAPAIASTKSAATSGVQTTTKASVANVPCAQLLSPIILGQTAPTSGIIGASTFNMRTGIALWAQAANAAGGVQCHPIQVIQMDDGADPARVTSNLETMKSKGAVAIVGAGVPTTISAAKQFAEKNKMPFIGGDLIEAPWFSSPWMFPQGGSPLASYAGALKQAAKAAGGTKVGLVYCVEAGSCGLINENFEAMAKASGLQVVLRKVSSITSPDYTAECQSLKAAGADAVFVALEGSGTSRFARSCVSLGYTPPLANAALAMTAEVAADPNMRKLGAFLGGTNAPFVANDTAGGRDFRAAYDRFAPGASIDQNLINQWTSGKLFEKALEKVAAQARSGPVTTDLILQGLWQIKNETLLGLAPGVTFNKNAPPVQNDCYALLNLAADGFKAPLGSKFDCFSGLPRGY